jgi:signal transduction histidine kinase
VERQRIGEQLHDRFAQALAFAGLELDRLTARYPDDADLAALRDEVRATLGELRERLRELRLRCTESRGLDAVLAEHAAHVERSTGLRIRIGVTTASSARRRSSRTSCCGSRWTCSTSPAGPRRSRACSSI